MFNLEQAIADWRQNMLACGIETPVPLEELELHLREEMERQLGKGLNTQAAFEKAVWCIGDGQVLKVEFKNAGTVQKFSYNQVYDKILVLFAPYMGVITLEMAYGSPYDSPLYAGGSIAAFWMGLFRNGLVRKGLSLLNADLADSVPAWVIALNIICLAAIVATLWARRFRPKSGAHLTRLLNWMLLPMLPLGTLVGLFGLGSAELEKLNQGAPSRLGKLLILTKVPAASHGLAAALRITCIVEAGLFGLGFLWFGFMLAISIILRPSFPFLPPSVALRFLPINTFFIPVVVFGCLALGSWMLWGAWQAIRFPQTRHDLRKPMFKLKHTP